MRGLLLSAYDARSHTLWRQRLTRMLPDIHWQQLILSPRNFNWRIRSNSLHWAINNREELTAEYDFLLATSMVDLSSLRGFVPQLTQIPNIVYFHENQFAYPLSERGRDNVEPLLVPIYSALCADKIVFNSEFNRCTFIEGTRSLFDKLPDAVPDQLLEKLEVSSVIPVPVNIPLYQATTRDAKKHLDVVWNHRWEYDKGPNLLLAVVRIITEHALPFRVHVVGQSFREIPAAFREIEKLLKNHQLELGMEPAVFGYLEQEHDYYQLLSSCDVVLSTALHDFQGLAMQEACLAGCTPLAPNALVYPEYLPQEFLFDAEKDDAAVAGNVVDRLTHWLALSQQARLPKVDLRRFTFTGLQQEYEQLLEVTS
ncbi:MAG: DUF3524 domain-containing protein [Gammaproteobacteria bacterium]|nr:DUF3524 domain-containing protein [Gammaproteobacteria bacterium]MDD9897090.1 DUF3524 domain-containing protein [Gammaproteobacteria bacterium]MDD9959021.1 DUF3524 domain-containing protein [Gammaproteobacteria bacterium]